MAKRSQSATSQPKDLASELLARTGRASDSYATSILDSETAWRTLSSLFHPLPIPEQISFLNAIYSNLRTEYDRQFAAAEQWAREEDHPGPLETTFWTSIRCRGVLLRDRAKGVEPARRIRRFIPAPHPLHPMNLI
ncbi:MAG TPA: hypothetical protein VHI13_10745 [Candidatus Kapabacteria bacterium]|nr:hypothetical protein [Candidatus Kapabacteria bacterium]